MATPNNNELQKAWKHVCENIYAGSWGWPGEPKLPLENLCFLFSSSTLAHFSHKAEQALLVMWTPPVMAPLPRAIEIHSADRAPDDLKVRPGPRALLGVCLILLRALLGVPLILHLHCLHSDPQSYY